MDLGLEPSYGIFIDNEFRAAHKGGSIAAINASTGEHLSEIAAGTKEDIDAAVASAKSAFKSWAAPPVDERAAALLKLAEALEADADRHASIHAADIGRKKAETFHDQLVAIGQYRYFAAAIQTFEGISKPIAGGHFIGKREPLGVCGQIIPWNVPAIMVALKIAPAVAAGNTLVLKPDENASLSTLETCRKIAAIFPPGVINVVTGRGTEAGQALISHPGIRKLAFTGSTGVGKIVAQAGAAALVPVTLELGGKSPNIVFPDIENIDAVVDNVAFAATYCNGQSCLAGTRLFLHDDIYDTFIDRLAAAMAKTKVGSPFASDTTLSCLVNEKQGRKVLDYIDGGRKEGATIKLGGGRATVAGHEYGYFIEPTIIEAENRMTISQEEIFGPVLSVIRWNDREKMIAECNDTRYGLASGMYTSNLANALETADQLEAGMVWVNQYFNLQNGTPFGGVKESGIGREFSHDTLRNYTQWKSITLVTNVPTGFFTRV